MHDIAALIERYGVAVVFLNVLLSQAGLPLPIYPTLVVAAALGAGNGLREPEILFAAVAAALIADTAWFSASRRYGRRILGLLCKLSLSPDSCVRQTESMFSRTGATALLVAKFVPGLGLVSIALSGVMGVPLLTFVAFDGLGAGLYASSAVLLGIIFRHAIHDLLATLSDLGGLGLVLLASALVLYMLVRWYQRQAFIRQLRMDRITPAQLAEMIDNGSAPVVLDVRAREVRARDGIIPGAVFAHPDETRTLFANMPRDLEIVVYCSCPNEASAAIAAQHLKRAGFKRIRPLLGGIQAWSDLGRPIETVTDTEIVEPAPASAGGVRTAVWSDLIS